MAESIYQESYIVAGLPGATAGTRLAGATVSGAPISGNFLTGDSIVDQTGAIWICTASGNPGTWASVAQDIVPLDNLQYNFNGISTYYTPTYQGSKVTTNNPFRLQVLINGVKQKVTSGPDTVWLSYYPIDGMWVDANGNLAFSEVPPAGSSFDGTLNPGLPSTSNTTIYPFTATDILLGA